MTSNLYLFDLPVELLDTLKPRELAIPADHPLRAVAVTSSSSSKSSVPPPEQAESGKKEDNKYYCAVTGASFDTLEQLRQHYKTDWYRYNLKLKSQGKPAGVSEHQFNALVEGLSDSLSGTDTATDDDEVESEDSENALSRVLAKQSLQDGDAMTDEPDLINVPRSSLLWFEAPSYRESTQFGLYRSALPSIPKKPSRELTAEDEGQRAIADLRALQIKAGVEPEDRKWTLLMFGGGHFAGMVVSLVPKLVSRGKGKEKERQVVILHSKTFHRYTTRRKQGGGQGANDAANGKAKSAGAQIRRYNEAMLAEEVQGVLRAWSDDVRSSELVFLRASKSNHRLFFDFEGSPLDRGDSKIRGFSFPTRRPTLAELTKSFVEMTRVKVTHLSADELAQLDADYLASVKKKVAAAQPPSSSKQQQQRPPPSSSKTPAPPKLTKEQEVERDRWDRLLDMVRKGRVEAVESFLDKHGPEVEVHSPPGLAWGTLPEWIAPSERNKTPTLLHVASAADQADMVRWLLVSKRANPTVRASLSALELVPLDQVDLDRSVVDMMMGEARTPYEVAPSRTTRNVFRFLAHSNAGWFDWLGTGLDGARVPSALTEEMEEQRDAKGKERRNKLREKLKERDEKRALQQEQEREDEQRARASTENKVQAEQTTSGPQRLGTGSGPGARLASAQTGATLTDEQRMRLMREQRARAAEARLRKS